MLLKLSNYIPVDLSHLWGQRWNNIKTAFITIPDTQEVLSKYYRFSSVQFSSITQWCPTLCNPMNRSTPGLSVHHQLPQFTQTHIHRVSDVIQSSHLLLSPSPPAPNHSQHQSLFKWVNSSHEVAKVLEFLSALASFLPKKSQGWSPF